MGWLEFVSALVGQILSWPVAVVALVLVLRGPIADLIPKLNTMEAPGVKFDFGQNLNEAEESAEKAASSVAPDVTQSPDQVGSDRPTAGEIGDGSDLSATAAENPSFLVLRSWERLSHAVYEFAITVDSAGRKTPPETPTPRGPNINKAMSILIRSGSVSADFVDAVNRLRDLRNAVAHGQHNPTSGEALAYAETASELSYVAAASASNIFKAAKSGSTENQAS